MYEIEEIVQDSLKNYLAGNFEIEATGFPVAPGNEYLQGALSEETLGFECDVRSAYSTEEEIYPCAVIEVTGCENEIKTKNIYSLDVEIEVITSTDYDADKTKYKKIVSELIEESFDLDLHYV